MCLLCCVVRHKRVFHSKVFGWTQELFEACQQSAAGRNGAQWCIAHQGPSGIMDEIMPERGLVLQSLYCNNFVTRNRLEAHISLIRLWHLLYIYVTYLKKNFLSQHHQTLYSVESDIKARLKYCPEIIYIHITRLTDGWWLVLRPVNGKEVIFVWHKPRNPIFYRLRVSRNITRKIFFHIDHQINLSCTKNPIVFSFLCVCIKGCISINVKASCLVNGPGNRWKGSSDCYHALHCIIFFNLDNITTNFED